MTKNSRELGPKQIAWCNKHIPGFRHTRKVIGAVADRARATAAKAMEERTAA